MALWRNWTAMNEKFHETTMLLNTEVFKIYSGQVTICTKLSHFMNIFSQVGGYWDKSCSTVTQLKEGLNRILCLIPYNVISQPLWECFMPEWLEAIRTEVPDHQLKEFREVLRYIHYTSLYLQPLVIIIPVIPVKTEVVVLRESRLVCT